MRLAILKTVLLFLLTSLGIAAGQAQSAAPDGEATPTIALTGTVQNREGGPFPNAHITARRVGGGLTASATSNDQGHFSLDLTAGRYNITAEAPDLPPANKSVNVSSDQPARVSLTLAKPYSGQVDSYVPDAEPAPNAHGSRSATGIRSSAPPADVPLPTSGPVAVEAQFQSRSDLSTWLNGQSARNLRLEAVLSTTAGRDVFVWTAHNGHKDEYTVVPATLVRPADLPNLLKDHPQSTVVGGIVHVFAGRYIILRSNGE